MAKFELYHPIMTPHFSLDWLTQFKVKDINALRQRAVPGESMIDTASYVNREMSTVMHDQALTWGVAEKQSANFRGIVHLIPHTSEATTAQLTIIPVKQPDDALVSEIQTYMRDFTSQNFNQSTLQLTIK